MKITQNKNYIKITEPDRPVELIVANEGDYADLQLGFGVKVKNITLGTELTPEAALAVGRWLIDWAEQAAPGQP